MIKDLQVKFINEAERRLMSCVDTENMESVTPEAVLADVGEKALVDAVFSGRKIRRCKNCGRFFVVQHGLDVYCDNRFAGKKTCKQVGVRNTRNKDPITKEMIKAQSLHLKRRSVAGKTDVACKRYEAWQRYARSAEKKCRAGDISLDEFSAMIGKAYEKDKAARRRG